MKSSISLWMTSLVLVLSTLLALFTSHTSGAVTSGKILVSIYDDATGASNIYSIQPDGSGSTQLTSTSGANDAAKLSPDGTKIVFASSRDGNREIYIMDSDGNNEIRLTNHAASDSWPVWSVSGDKIIFETMRNGHADLYSIAPNGSSLTNLTSTFASHISHKGHLKRVPQSNMLFFTHGGDLYRMGIDGTNIVQLTTSGVVDGWAVSENTPKVVFNEIGVGVRVMNTDGTGLVTIDNDDTHDVEDISADGSKVMYRYSVASEDQNDLYMSGIDGSNYERVTNDTDFTYDARFSPDSSKIIWHSDETTTWNAGTVRIANTDGSGAYTLLPMEDGYWKGFSEWTIAIGVEKEGTTINASLSSVISVSTSGTVAISLTPSGGSKMSSNSDTVSVSTNNSTGYALSLSNQDTTTTLANGGNTIAAHNGTLGSPTNLTANTWGFRVDSVGGFGAGPTSTETNANSSAYSWAGVPSSAAPVQLKSTGSTASNDATTVWYGVMVDSSTPNGVYSDTVTYTAVTN